MSSAAQTDSSPIRRSERRSETRYGTAWLLETGIVVALAVLLVWGIGMSTEGPAAFKGETIAVQVEQGDTLWEIARAYPVQGETVRETVDTIRALNGVDSSNLQPGAVLTVPAPVADDVAMASR